MLTELVNQTLQQLTPQEIKAILAYHFIDNEKLPEEDVFSKFEECPGLLVNALFGAVRFSGDGDVRLVELSEEQKERLRQFVSQIKSVS